MVSKTYCTDKHAHMQATQALSPSCCLLFDVMSHTHMVCRVVMSHSTLTLSTLCCFYRPPLCVMLSKRPPIVMHAPLKSHLVKRLLLPISIIISTCFFRCLYVPSPLPWAYWSALSKRAERREIFCVHGKRHEDRTRTKRTQEQSNNNKMELQRASRAKTKLKEKNQKKPIEKKERDSRNSFLLLEKRDGCFLTIKVMLFCFFLQKTKSVTERDAVTLFFCALSKPGND